MILGISGASRSGKSTLALELEMRISGASVTIIEQDNFTYPEATLPKIGSHIDWEHPDGINFPKLKDAIQHSNADITIVEGFLLFFDPPLFEMLDVSIFIDIRYDEFKERKRSDTRWGGPVSEFYIEHIWQSYLKFGRFNVDKVDHLIPTDQIHISVNDILTPLNLNKIG